MTPYRPTVRNSRTLTSFAVAFSVEGGMLKETGTLTWILLILITSADHINGRPEIRQRFSIVPAFAFPQTSDLGPVDNDSALIWAIRGASALTSYFGLVAWNDRPRGQLLVNDQQVEIKQSTVPGAGLGLFAKAPLSKGTVLGTYPGVVLPLQQHGTKLKLYPACEGYIWRFSDNRFVIDPTNSEGNLESICLGGNPNQMGSMFLFENVANVLNVGVPTALCRINEPPRGQDVNVATSEDLEKRCVTFLLERNVYTGEEFFIDYGLSYDRSRYGI